MVALGNNEIPNLNKSNSKEIILTNLSKWSFLLNFSLRILRETDSNKSKIQKICLSSNRLIVESQTRNYKPFTLFIPRTMKHTSNNCWQFA